LSDLVEDLDDDVGFGEQLVRTGGCLVGVRRLEQAPGLADLSWLKLVCKPRSVDEREGVA